MTPMHYTLRTLLRGRSSSIIKLASLTLGLVVGVLLFSQIAYELSYERCYPDAGRLVLVRCTITDAATGEVRYANDETVFDVMAPAMAADIPQWVESATTVGQFGATIYYNDKLLDDARVIYADTCFFRTMGIPVLEGDQRDMAMPGTAFVSQSFAKSVFGDEDPVGKQLSLDKKSALTVRGVYRDMSDNSMLKHDIVLSIHQNGGYVNGAGWNGNDIFLAILRLRQVSDVEQVNGNIQRMVQKHIDTDWQGLHTEYNVIPLPDFHTDNPDTRKRLAILGFLGFAIFFVAALNYILISIATLSYRAKAVGVHKCNGASAGQVFAMFLMETGVIVAGAVALSLLLLYLFRSQVEDLLGTPVASLFTWQTLWVPVLTVLLLFVVAGVLPGRMFSTIPVTQVFRRYTEGKKGWKRGLLAVQFTGVAFVLGLLMVTILQYSMLMNRDMGFRIPGLAEGQSWQDVERGASIVDYLRRQPYVEGVAVSSTRVLGEYWTQGLIGNDGKRIATLNYMLCQKEYPEVMGLDIIEGTTLQKPGDVLVNEEVVRLMKWTDGAVGKKLNDFQDGKAGSIVGVFRNVRNTGFYDEQNPIALVNYDQLYYSYEVRLKEPFGNNLQKLNDFVLQTFPDVSLRFYAVSDLQKNMYNDVYRFRNSVYVTSLFIVLIVFMGLVGYVNDETGRRAKEIAIRKVNGAGAGDILSLLSDGILRVALPCVVVGAVAAYFVGSQWLSQFAGQVAISLWQFLILIFILLVLIVLVVVVKAWRIANENPVESIKNE